MNSLCRVHAVIKRSISKPMMLEFLMTMMTDELRLEALREAVKVHVTVMQTGGVNAPMLGVTDRADAYYEFLTGQKDKDSGVRDGSS